MVRQIALCRDTALKREAENHLQIRLLKLIQTHNGHSCKVFDRRSPHKDNTCVPFTDALVLLVMIKIMRLASTLRKGHRSTYSSGQTVVYDTGSCSLIGKRPENMHNASQGWIFLLPEAITLTKKTQKYLRVRSDCRL